MSTLQKLFIGPANSVSCKSCGRGVTLLWRHYLLVIVPAAIALAVLSRFFAGSQLISVGLVLALAVGIAQLLLPLQKDRF